MAQSKRNTPAAKKIAKALPPKLFLIDPEHRLISLIEEPAVNLNSLIAEEVGKDADCYKLDCHDNVLWCSDTDVNERHAYYFNMPFPFNVRRYSKGLVVSLGPVYWSKDTVKDWLRWYDKKNVWGD